MTALKLDSKLGAPAQQSLDRYIPGLYGNAQGTLVGVVEIKHVEKTVPAADSDKTAKVTARVTHFEVASEEHEDAVRELLRTLFLLRTARGTLDEDGTLNLDATSIRQIGDNLRLMEVARLRAGVDRTMQYLDRVKMQDKLTPGELRHEIDAAADMLRAALNLPGEDDDQEELPLDGGEG